MHKFIQAIVFIVLLISVIFLGNRILDEEGTDFAEMDQLSRQRAAIEKNVTELKEVTMKKADELKKLYKSVKDSESEGLEPDVFQETENASFGRNAGSELNMVKLKHGDNSSTRLASNDPEFLDKVHNIQKKVDQDQATDLEMHQHKGDMGRDSSIATDSENDQAETNSAESKKHFSPIDKEDQELTRQILAYGSRSDETIDNAFSVDPRKAADEVKDKGGRVTTDLDNMAAIMELYSKAAAVLDIK